MKNKLIFLFTALPLLLLSSCEKPNKEQGEYYGKFQKACVRLKVQNNTSGERKAQVVGDSAAVWKCVRWGTNLRFFDFHFQTDAHDGLSLNRWDMFDRDTIECTYIFGYECVVRYGRTEPDENGIYQGVPGSEEWGILMEAENFVICGLYHDTICTYYDPFLEDKWSEIYDPHATNDKLHYDTLGYIPNSIVRANRERLIPLFNEGKYSEMMKIMENDYVIYTCTGEEYRELVRQGLN